MLYLIGSIVLSSFLTLAFKLCGRLKIDIFPTIVFNYITCVITGSIVNGAFPVNSKVVSMPWFYWAILMGAMFISLFNLIGITTQRNGVAVASVSNKLSLIIPVLLSVYLYNESVYGWKLAGVLLALVAVVFTCLPAKYSKTSSQNAEQKSSPKTGRKISGNLQGFLPVILFVGSGLLDALINHVQKHFVTDANSNAYLISGFLFAAIIGLTVLFFQYATRQREFDRKHVIAGVLIGIPNYFSIWCLLIFLKKSPWESSASIPMNNMGIVLFSTLIAALFFKEKLSAINWLGVVLSIVSIYMIAFGNQW